MGEILLENKNIAVPGEVIAKGMDYLPGQGTYREGENIRAGKLGLVSTEGRAIKLISLSGKYLPKRGDTVIGRVDDVAFSGWRVNLNCAYSAMLSIVEASSEYIPKGADLTKYMDVGDYIIAKITNVTSQILVDLTMKGPGLRMLSSGRILEVNTNKVPRIIGKQGSMVSMIKQATDCRILVGQNGLVWIQGEPKGELVAVETIKKIERESHISGLTDRIKEYLEKETGKKIEVYSGDNMGDENREYSNPQRSEKHFDRS
jgi:exosome complex component RRP4